jgi:hypothetical protein
VDQGAPRATPSPGTATPIEEAPIAVPTSAPSPPVATQGVGGEIAPTATQPAQAPEQPAPTPSPGPVEQVVDAVTGLVGLGR